MLDILTPLLGDVTTALQGFIDIGKIGMGVVKFINIITDQVRLSKVIIQFYNYLTK